MYFENKCPMSNVHRQLISDWSNCQYYQVKEKTTSSFISLILKLVLSINELNIHIIYYS